MEVTGLAEVDAAVLVKDVKVPASVEGKAEAESLVAKIEPLAAEEPKEAPVPVEGEAGAVAGEVPVEGEVKGGEGEKKETAEAVKVEEPAKE